MAEPIPFEILTQATTLAGRRRTQREYAELFDDAGFRFERGIPTGANVSILEATPI